MPYVWDKKKQKYVEVPGKSGGASARPKSTDIKWSNDPETAKLQAQNYKLDAKTEAYGGKVHKGGPSLLSRAFDVLSRGQYASAAAVQGALKKGGRGGIGGSLIDALTGAKKGLEGKRKASYSQVLQEHGVKNRLISTVGGLAGDIFLDPTTYLGPGLLKGIEESTVAATKSAKVLKTLQAAEDVGRFEKLGQEAKTALRSERLLAGLKTPTKKELEAVAKAAVDKESSRLTRIAEKSVGEATPGKVQLKFAGRKLAESEKLYQAGKAVKGRVAETELGRAASELFSNKVGPLTESLRRNHGREISLFDEWANKPIVKAADGKEYSWRNLPLTKDDKEFIHAVESGHVKEFIQQNGAINKHGIHYEDLADAIKKSNKELYDVDASEGFINPELSPPVENYVYHTYNAPTEKQLAFKAKRRKVMSDVFKPGMERQIPTLKEAAKAGLNPEEDLRVIMLNRGAKSFQSTARKSIIQDAVDRFGVEASKNVSKLAKGGERDLVNLKSHLMEGLSKEEAGRSLQWLPDNIHIDRNVADHLRKTERTFQTPDEIKKFVGLFDNVTSKWKSAATVYNPGHHIRNLSTDVFLSYLDGVKSLKPYEKARKIMWGKGALEGETELAGHSFSNKDLLNLFKESGASPSWMITNVDEGSKLLHGKISSGLHKVSQEREEYGRFAHWLHAFEEEMKGKNPKNFTQLQEASQKAASRVRHWHIDYTDLTPFERNVMKRVVPFYTWARHSTPLMIEAMLTKPGKVATVPKSLTALEKLTGVDPADKLPVDLIPKWIREAGGIQVGHGGNPKFLTPFFFPGAETAQYFETGRTGPLNIGAGLLGNVAAQTNPLLRAPFELGTGHTLYGNMPIENTSDYLINQVPISRNLSFMRDNIGDPDKRDMYTRLLRYLTGIGIQEATPNRIRGEIRRQMDPKEAYMRKVRESQR